jgi:xanthine dehydrogenase small subunit
MTEPIRFLLNGAPAEVTGLAPQTTLLDYLRETRGLTGTKEGCAEGDCGACTVVLAELAGHRRDAGAVDHRTAPIGNRAAAAAGGRLAWRPVNACIRLLPTIDGKAVYTVEALRGVDGALHPVQQALVDTHASQCGFCTPGFVMSLFALYKNGPAPTREAACDALSGNLCRCTGYRPIIDAALRMHALPAPDDWRAPDRGEGGAEAALAASLAAIARTGTFEYAADGQSWLAPRTLDALAAACATRPDAHLVAGATDLGLWVTKEHRALGDLIHVGEVDELHALTHDAAGVTIGAAVPLADAFATLDQTWPELHEAWVRFGSPPIRASGTLGGNVANGSPIGDSMPALIALGATVTLARDGARRELALESFHIDYRRTARAPREVVAALRMPPRAANLLLRAYKIGKRYDQDISAVFACFALELAGGRVSMARIGCGGVAPVPTRARRTEATLTGALWSERTALAAAATLASEFAPIDDFRASADYRRAVLGNLMLRLWHDSVGQAPARIEAVHAG